MEPLIYLIVPTLSCAALARLILRRRSMDYERWSLIALGLCFTATLILSWLGAFSSGETEPIESIFAGIKATFAHLEGDSDDFREFAGNISDPARIASYILSCAIPILTVLTALRLLWHYLPHHVPFGANTLYLFSELDANSVRMARSLGDGSNLCIFLRTRGDKADPELLKDLGETWFFLYPGDEAQFLHLWWRRFRTLRFFFLSENTDENFNRMSDLLDSVRNKRLFRGSAPKTGYRQELFLLSETESAPMLIDHLREKLYDKNGKRLPAFQSTELHLLDRFRATGYDLIRSAPFHNCIPGDKLNILVLGFGKIGREFFRAACHMGVIHGCTTTFTLCDIDICTKSRRFLTQCPELHRSADFHFRKLDAETEELETLVRTNEFHYILVALGDDERNIRTASRLKQHYRRQHWESHIPGGQTSYHPQICVNVEDTIKHTYTEKLWTAKEKWEKSLYVFGSLDQTFTPDVLMPRKYWDAARMIHEMLLPDDSSPDQLWSEYERRSSFACAANPRYHLGNPTLEELCRTEHRRWMTFVRSEGMTHASRELMDAYFTETHSHVDILGKLSPCLTEDTRALEQLWDHLCAQDEAYKKKIPFTARDKIIITHTNEIKNQTK